jgi:hypothetical protein
MVSTLIGALVCVCIVREYGIRGLWRTGLACFAAFCIGALGFVI